MYLIAIIELAKQYQCTNETKTLNLAVKRHLKRFMFQLTKEEYNYLWFQVKTTNNIARSLPYAFTEQRVVMLVIILRTKVAEEVNIRIMDAFTEMRKYINNNLCLFIINRLS